MLASTQQHYLSELTKMIVAIRPELAPADIGAASSITADLGLASLEMIELSARVREHWSGVNLTRWWGETIRTEDDSLGSLAAFLHRAATPAETTVTHPLT